jgi:hypothetical protein
LNQLRLFELKNKFLKISEDLQTALTAEAHLAEGQWLDEQLNMVKLPMFRVGNRTATFSGNERQQLPPL